MTLQTSYSMPAAVTLYIVHHPELNTTSQIARELHLWFRLGDSIGNQSDAGLPVWYRREVRAAADKPGGIDFHPEIRFEDSRLNVVVLLVDQHFVASVDWCNAAERLVQQYEQEESRLLILPVALHDSFYRLSTVYEKHNPIRLLDEPDPRRSSIALRRLVSECITRRLRQKSVADLPAKLEVFLSHAKADGRKVAEMIRDSLSQFGQLEAWYDANELAFGQNWKEKICKAAGKNTAAMISIVTDTYASRPWCRTEVEVARTPQPVGNSRRIWKLQPAVAVHVTGSSWSRTMQGVAGMPRIGWNIANPSASVAAIVDRLMLETMLSHSHRHTARQLERKMAKGSTPEKLQDTLFITWTPCHYTLAKLRESVNQKQNDRSSEIQTIVFPGNDLRAAEASDLQPILKTFGTNTRLLSFEDAFRTLDAQELTNENQLPPNLEKEKSRKNPVSHQMSQSPELDWTPNSSLTV